MHPTDIYGAWAIWQPPGSSLTTLVQQGFKNGDGFGQRVNFELAVVEVPPYRVDAEGTAVIEIVGPTMKYDAEWFGGTSSIDTRLAVEAAVADPEVKSIILHIDSPGGKVAGTKELADAVATASQIKPCYAYCEDLCCSAIYWVGSQCTKMFANEMAIIGSIGTMMVLTDSSAAYESFGLKVKLVKSGEFKGAGTAGLPITDEQLAEFQTIVDGFNAQFVTAAAKGRRMALRNMKALADGRAHLAATALEMGLIDGIQSFEETMSMMPKARAPRRSATAMWDAETGAYLDHETVAAEIIAEATASVEQQQELMMSEPETKPEMVVAPAAVAPVVAPAAVVTPVVAAATLADLKAACPGALADFLLTQLEANATVATANAAWTVKLTADLAAQAAEILALKAKPSMGVETLGDGAKGAAAPPGDAIAAFETLKATYVAKYEDKAKALRMLVAEHRDVHAAYVAAFNALHPFKPRA